MAFIAKRTLDCIPRGERVATCLMKHITVAGHKVFKVSSISLFVSLIVLISCSHKYNLITLATATNGIFAVANTLVVVIHCSQKYNLSILVTVMYNYLLILTV